MTQEDPRFPPGYPPQYQPPPPPKHNRHTVRNVILVISGIVVLMFAGCIAFVGAVGNEAAKTLPTLEPTATASVFTTSAPVTSTQPEKPRFTVPRPADIKLTVKIRSKQCFGDAGCLVEYRVEPALASTQHPDPSITYDVTYEVRGDESGPQVDTMTLTGRTYESDTGNMNMASTPSTKTKLVAVVTSIEEQ